MVIWNDYINLIYNILMCVCVCVCVCVIKKFKLNYGQIQ
jgi:hypothetical protein